MKKLLTAVLLCRHYCYSLAASRSPMLKKSAAQPCKSKRRLIDVRSAEEF